MKTTSWKIQNEVDVKNLSWDHVDFDRSVLLTFGNVNDDFDVVRKISKQYPKLKIIGSSAAYVIEEDNVSECQVFSLIEFEKSKTHVGFIDINNYEDSFNVGELLWKRTSSIKDVRNVLVFTDAEDFNGAEFSKGIEKENLGKIKYLGGLAGRELNNGVTYIYINGEWRKKSIVFLAIEGNDVRMESSSYSGVTSISAPKTITKSKNNVLFELDGIPALDFYKKYLGPSGRLSR